MSYEKYATVLDYSLLKVSGEKSAPLLHGQLTNTIQSLKIGEGNFNLLLNKKGKIQTPVEVLKMQEDQFLILLPKISLDLVVNHFKLLLKLSRVQLECIENIKICHFFTHQLDWISQKSLDDFSCGMMDENIYFVSNRYGINGVDFIMPTKDFDLLEKKLKFIDQQQLERIRIDHKIPQFLKDYDQTNLPQEALLDHCLHFNKGCYLGQEIIARLHFKGHVTKVLAKLKIHSSKLADWPSQTLEFAGKEVGKITSLVFDEEHQVYLGLGYVPYQKNTKGENFFLKNSKLSVEIID